MAAVAQYLGMGPVFRAEMGYYPSYHYYYHHPYPYTVMEKRQLFLRSYQFRKKKKKKSVAERMKGSFVRVKRVTWVRFRSARKVRKLVVWLRLKLHGLFNRTCRKTRFLPLHKTKALALSSSSSSSGFWY